MPDERWRRVKELFSESVALSTAEREVFLAERCDDLLRPMVRSLLRSHDAAGDFMESPLAVVGISDDDNSSLAGLRIGPYHIEREIGHGGMGRVYLAARADGTFEKQVALKVVQRGLDVEEVLLRFRHERETLAGLDHPNIARLLDAGSTDDGLPYFVMEYVDGQPVDVYCDKNGLTVRERLGLFRTICAAVHAAHRNLVVHRDIKPDNVLVTSDRTPKLVDFGIAKVLAPSRVTTPLTREHERLLTPEYASPEQRLGLAITVAADVYSLGVLLHELLTGRRPTLAAAAEAAGTGGVEYEIELPSGLAVRQTDEPGQPERLSAARRTSPAGLRRQLRGDLDAIIAKALRWEPHQRYGSVEQFAEDIYRHLAGLPIHVRREAIAYRASKFLKRHVAGVTAAAVSLAALTAGVSGIAWEARKTAAERDHANLEAGKARQISAFLQEMLRAADPENSGRDTTVVETLDRAAKRVDADLASHPDLAVPIRRTLGVTYNSLGVYDAAETQLRAALAALPERTKDGRVERAAVKTELAGVLASRNERSAAEQFFRQAIAEYRALGVHDDVGLADALNGLGETLRFQGDNKGAEAHYRLALEIRRRLLGERDVAVAESLNNLAVVMQERNELAEAERLYRESLIILRAARGDDHPGVPATLGNLAMVVGSRGNLAAAEPLYEEALAIRRRLLGPDHPDVTYTMYGFADTLVALGKYDRAATLMRDVIGRRGRTLPDNHPIVAASLLILGKSLLGLSDPRGAEAPLREALAIRKTILPAGHWQTFSAQSTLGRCLAEQRRFREAEPLLVEAYRRLEADRGPTHERTRDALDNVVRLYELWRKPEEASYYRARQAT